MRSGIPPDSDRFLLSRCLIAWKLKLLMLIIILVQNKMYKWCCKHTVFISQTLSAYFFIRVWWLSSVRFKYEQGYKPNSRAHIGGKFIKKKSFTRFALQSECYNFKQWEELNSQQVTWFVLYNPAYTKSYKDYNVLSISWCFVKFLSKLKILNLIKINVDHFFFYYKNFTEHWARASSN